MRTQNLNLAEALNLALAGHIIKLRTDKAESIQFISGELTITKTPTVDHPNKTTRLLDGRDFNWLKDEKFHAGDDRSIIGYY